MPSCALPAPTGEKDDPRNPRGRRHRLGCIVLIAILTAKQPTLFAQLKSLSWGQAPVLFTESGRGDRRAEARTVRMLTAPQISFPQAKQALRVHRWVKESATGRVRRTYAYVVTSLSADKADAARLAGLVHGRWRIEALDTSFHLPGVPNIDLTRINSGSGSSGGGFWNSLPGGAWLYWQPRRSGSE